MRRPPLVATLIVLLAVTTMIALGVWQLQRRVEKERLLADLATNPARPVIPFPDPPYGDTLLFRRSTATCAAVRAFAIEGAGNAGFRVIARCARSGGGEMAVQLGTTHDAEFRPRWAGGAVTGRISHAPDHRPLIATVFARGHRQELLLVADSPAPGLTANGVPGIESVPNNHLAYAVQWFIFAAVALVIYALALWRRERTG